MSFRSLLLFVCATSLISSSYAEAENPAAERDLPAYGLEIELVPTYGSNPRLWTVERSSLADPLHKLKEQLGDSEGNVVAQPWTRFKQPGAWQAVYKAPDNREWKVTPERVGGSKGFDGLELVTPRLAGSEDDQTVGNLLESIENDAAYSTGDRSSLHVTVDASHLVTPQGDASKLVDTILYIESHWAEIYGAVSPRRYGTVVNRFALPLAVDHPELLQELARLPKEQRTFRRVQSLFEKHLRDELRASQYDTKKKGRVWKPNYRAANYLKVFGLGGQPKTGGIEFRIADYEGAERSLEVTQLLRRLVKGAHEQPTSNQFVSQLPRFDRERVIQASKLEALDRALLSHSTASYPGFLSAFGSSEAEFPRFGSIEGPLTQGLYAEERAAALSSLDSSKPIVIGNARSPVTLGFEAELDKRRASSLVKKGPKEGKFEIEPQATSALVSRTDRFPFLDPTVTTEETGNIEVRSAATDKMDEVFKQMSEIESGSGDGVKSFHLHMRVPNSAIAGLSRAELNAWLSRISDSVFAWRLQNFDPEWAFGQETQGRVAPDNTEEHGTIRVRDFPGEVDIEIRGHMSEIEPLRRTAKTILAGLSRPELVRGYPGLQDSLHKAKQTLEERMLLYVRKHELRDLTPLEIDILRHWETETTNYEEASKNRGSGNLPLFGFEEAPYLSPLEKARVQQANGEFDASVAKLLQTTTSRETAKVRPVDPPKNKKAALSIIPLVVDALLWSQQIPSFVSIGYLAGRLSKKNKSEKEDFGLVAYQRKIKQWATDAELHHLLDRSLLLSPERTAQVPRFIHSIEQAFASLKSADTKLAHEAEGFLKNESRPRLFEYLRGKNPRQLSVLAKQLEELGINGTDKHPFIAVQLGEPTSESKQRIEVLAKAAGIHIETIPLNQLLTRTDEEAIETLELAAEKLLLTSSVGNKSGALEQLAKWALRNSDFAPTRRVAAHVLTAGDLNASSTQLLSAALASDPSEAVRLSIVDGLTRTENPNGFPVLFKALSDASPKVVEAANKMMTEAVAVAPTSVLLDVLQTVSEAKLLRAAAKELALRSDGEVWLDDVLQHPDRRVADEGRLALLSRTDERGRQLQNQHSVSRLTCVGSMVRIGLRL